MTNPSSQEKILREQNNTPSECDCCGWETSDLLECSARFNEQNMWLCIVCRSTSAGNSALFPTNTRNIADVLKTVAWGINYLKEKALSHTLSDRKAKLKEGVEGLRTITFQGMDDEIGGWNDAILHVLQLIEEVL